MIFLSPLRVKDMMTKILTYDTNYTVKQPCIKSTMLLNFHQKLPTIDKKVTFWTKWCCEACFMINVDIWNKSSKKVENMFKGANHFVIIQMKWWLLCNKPCLCSRAVFWRSTSRDCVRYVEHNYKQTRDDWNKVRHTEHRHLHTFKKENGY